MSVGESRIVVDGLDDDVYVSFSFCHRLGMRLRNTVVFKVLP